MSQKQFVTRARKKAGYNPEPDIDAKARVDRILKDMGKTCSWEKRIFIRRSDGKVTTIKPDLTDREIKLYYYTHKADIYVDSPFPIHQVIEIDDHYSHYQKKAGYRKHKERTRYYDLAEKLDVCILMYEKDFAKEWPPEKIRAQIKKDFEI